MPKRYQPNDQLSQQAKAEGYRARSVYKLKELDEKFNLIKPGMAVLDLGAAPGSWLQYAKERVGSEGKVIGIDLQEIEPIDGVETLQADITEPTLLTLPTIPKSIDLILSDLAPSTSGIKDVDQWKSIELNQAVEKIAEQTLKPGGVCVMKVFRGADFDEFVRELKNQWETVKTAQVKASRDRSREIYILISN
ncbi:MAG: RlmE family RNA methyltransferase [Candidatus Peribacteraceae bacterium]|jgi:23S rRNA (uridine2552-2'-O)-methyltransferase|nr:RlmE family RNA methyltransferase [Candidatus Peribacteraceae bacterium]|tara:strand:+ start:561 stop:1139 length:579 start_codon:yes stop_codon:yes gene_type:complete